MAVSCCEHEAGAAQSAQLLLERLDGQRMFRGRGQRLGAAALKCLEAGASHAQPQRLTHLSVDMDGHAHSTPFECRRS